MRGAAAKSLSAFLLLFFFFSSSAATFLQVRVVDKRKFGPRGANSLSTARLLQTGVCCCHLVRGHLTLNLSPSSGLPSTWTSTKQGATSREGRRSSAVCGSASDLICACRCFPPNASGFTRGATTVLLLLLCLYTW